MMTNYLVKEGENYSVISSKRRPKNAVAEVPGTFDREDFIFLKSTSVFDPDTGLEEIQVYIDEDGKGAYLSSKQKKQNVSAVKKQYLEDIDSEMMRVFGTIDRDRASSIYLTWIMMESRPTFYSDKGLVNDVGEPLDTASKVSEFASLKISLALDYSVFLISRRKQYDADKAAMEL